MIARWMANGLWMLDGAPSYAAFRRAWRDPLGAQEGILRRFLRRNAGSDYGRRHGYARLRTVAEFRDAVPVATWEDLEPWIEGIRRGRSNVLTTEPVLLLEKTSGSSGPEKYVPYTASLLAEFRRALGAWIFDLFARRPALLGGAQYWSISPAARRRERSPGGLPVGFDDDSEYLSPLMRRAAPRVMAVPGTLALLPDMDQCRSATLDHLLRCRDLRFISVWNPSFLTLLMGRLPRGARPADLWPDLRIISCWTSAAAARFLPELRALFPGVEIQGKGLLATEGVVSIPLLGRPGAVPAITSHFLEFVDPSGKARLAHELEVGTRCSVLLTTGGGLPRYAIGDEVEVVAPGTIEFVGRAGGVSDLCGEKLSEAFVGRVLEDVGARHALNGLAMLAPRWGSPPCYEFYVEAPDPGRVAAEVERGLRASVHYDYCRRLGQLGPLRGVGVDHGGERYLRACERMGLKPGNIKPAWLRRELDWRDRLEVRDAG